jgi:Domain of unknown function (DUF4136)
MKTIRVMTAGSTRLVFRTCVILLVFQALMCGADVKTWTGKQEDLSQYKTYKLLPVRVMTRNGLLEDDDTFSPMISNAVRKGLDAKGLVAVDHDEDLQVAAGAIGSVSQQIDVILYSFGVISSDGWTESEMGGFASYNHEGTLVVNLVNPKTNKSVWLGLAKQAIGSEERGSRQVQGKPTAVEAAVNKAAKALFRKYPGVKAKGL